MAPSEFIPPDWYWLPFLEALEAFRAKVPTPTNRPLDEALRDRAFYVSGIQELDELQAIADELERHIAPPDPSADTSLDGFISKFREIVSNNSAFSERRIRTIYDMNLGSAAWAGRQQQFSTPGFSERNPYRLWLHNTPSPEMGGAPREEHEKLDYRNSKAAYRYDDPELKRIKFPCGFGCNCQIVAANDRRISQLGLKVQPFPKAETVADPGFYDGDSFDLSVGDLLKGR